MRDVTGVSLTTESECSRCALFPGAAGRCRMRRPIRTVHNHSTAMFVSLLMFVPIYLVGVNSLKTDPQARSMVARLPPTPIRQLRHRDRGRQARSGLRQQHDIYRRSDAALPPPQIGRGVRPLAEPHRLNRYIYLFLVIGIAMPLNYVTLTRVMQATHLINTEIGMIIVYSAFKLPFAVFVIYAFIHTVPEEIDEAAIIDGCSPCQLFWLIMVPLLRPAWITVGILTFLDLWSEFIMPLYFLSSSDRWPMTLAIYNFFGISVELEPRLGRRCLDHLASARRVHFRSALPRVWDDGRCGEGIATSDAAVATDRRAAARSVSIGQGWQLRVATTASPARYGPPRRGAGHGPAGRGSSACPSENSMGVSRRWLYYRNEYSSQMTPGSAAAMCTPISKLVFPTAIGTPCSAASQPTLMASPIEPWMLSTSTALRSSSSRFSEIFRYSPGSTSTCRTAWEIDRSPSKSSRRHGSSIQ